MSSPQPAWQERFLKRYYYGQNGWIDGTSQFHQLIQKYLSGNKHVLELGPGPTNRTSDFLGRNYACVDGLDVDADAQANPALRKVYLYQGKQWPIEDTTYDAIVADYVFEHLPLPFASATDAYRVLRTGGFFFFRTPNLWHYTSMVSWLTPHWFHKWVANRLRNYPRDAHDPYPTYYRMNCRWTIRSVMRRAGFTEVELVSIEKEPSYGMSSPLLFYLFMAYEHIVNNSNMFSMFRANYLGCFVKPELRRCH